MTFFNRHLAAPSWVIPATLEENCRFLAGQTGRPRRVDEVGLLFFETEGSLAYTERDIPESLAALPLSFHVHLPVDLPWHDPERAARICRTLLQKVAFLSPYAPHCRAVLHPPPHDPVDAIGARSAAEPRSAAHKLAAFARAFTDAGGQTSLLLLENVCDNDLTPIMDPLLEHDFMVCLDSGHMLAYGQGALLKNDALLERTRMLHLCAPGGNGRPGAHRALTALDPAGEKLCRELVQSAPQQSVLMAELFCWQEIEASLPILYSWL